MSQAPYTTISQLEGDGNTRFVITIEPSLAKTSTEDQSTSISNVILPFLIPIGALRTPENKGSNFVSPELETSTNNSSRAGEYPMTVTSLSPLSTPKPNSLESGFTRKLT